jgi:N-acetylglucosamine-6-sulfatase
MNFRPRPRPGWSTWLSFAGQGSYTDPELQEGTNPRVVVPGYLTDLLTDRALEWIDSRHGASPWALVLSHKAVHGKAVPAARHKDSLAGAMLPEPPSFQDDLATKPWYQRAYIAWGGKAAGWEKARAEGRPVPDRLPPGPWRGDHPVFIDTFRCLLSVDDGLAKILALLERRGELDNTLVVFTSDNGLILGEHGLVPGGKQLLYEESIRIPMLVRYPPLVRAGTVIDRMVKLPDLAPTLFELCGAPLPKGVDGRSLVPLLRQSPEALANWPQELFCQHFLDPRWPGRPDMQGLRTDRWKYVRSPAYENVHELYDLASDPFELENLAWDASAIPKRHELSARLDVLLAQAEKQRLVRPG